MYQPGDLLLIKGSKNLALVTQSVPVKKNHELKQALGIKLYKNCGVYGRKVEEKVVYSDQVVSKIGVYPEVDSDFITL